LQRLPPSEAKKLLALAAVTLKARQRPPRLVAVIRTNGASISQDERKRLTRGQPDAGDRGPVVFDLSDLRAPSQSSTACSTVLWCGAG